MTPEQAETAIKQAIEAVAPDADTATLTRDADLQDSLELDSLDFLRFIEILSGQFGRIDEDDYPDMATLGGAVAFLTGRAQH